tara:strand:+ start:4817 stop:5572 length:756 start_codon:yes stop_codon:yes gene_type:complete
MLISLSKEQEIKRLTREKFDKLSRSDQKKYLEAFPSSSFRSNMKLPPSMKKVSDSLGVTGENLKIFYLEPAVRDLTHALGKGFKNLYDTIDKVIKLPNKAMRKGFEKLHKTKAFQALHKGTIKVDEFLEKNPVLKKMGGPVVAGALAYQWLNMSFSGDFDDDFNVDTLVEALQGNYSIEELLGSPDGLKACTQLVAGMATGGLLSFPWHSKMNIAFALAYTGARRLGNTEIANQMHSRFKKGLNNESPDFT